MSLISSSLHFLAQISGFLEIITLNSTRTVFSQYIISPKKKKNPQLKKFKRDTIDNYTDEYIYINT